jgi:hypothetical protein
MTKEEMLDSLKSVGLWLDFAKSQLEGNDYAGTPIGNIEWASNAIWNVYEVLKEACKR